MRALSNKFFNDLMNVNGLLHPILEQVKQDHTLMLAIRDGYINIYYRGGNLLKVKSNANGTYEGFFDKQYNKSEILLPALPRPIKEPNNVAAWIAALPHLKKTMDFFFSKHNKPEREFQQLVARENNCSTISNETEYFVSDIEFADSGLGARFDMLAIRWLASDRKNGCNCRAALIEMKYGDAALNGKAGILSHIEDIDSFISDSKRYNTLISIMGTQFNQLDQLGLLNFNRCSNGTKVQLDASDKPEVLFVLANHNPRSSKLKTILDDPEIIRHGQSQRFDLRFFVPSFGGYGLHVKCMQSLVEFRKLL